MDNLIVRVHEGRLRGIKERNINGIIFIAFRGVPYARPPIDNLRFRDCEPLEPWIGVRDAIKFGDQCGQQDWFTHNVIGGDNCLNLNIYTPTLNPQKPKAVMVWIHGGSFIHGSNRDELYGPDYLIEKDIVLVTINYRIGILGFLNADDEEAPGNQGLKDQVQALKWIQQNIAKFGGDPKNVTIFGESAGGASVHYLAISPLAQGLFHKAIMQSGVALNPWASSSTSPMDSVKRLAAILGKNIYNIKEFINYLRTLDIRTLIEASEKIETHQDKILFNHPFIPTIDSKSKRPFLTIPPEEAAKVGIKVPSICGHLSHEGIIATGVMNDKIYKQIDDDPENLLIHPTVLQFLKKHNLTVYDVKRFYFGDEIISAENNDKIIAIFTDIQFIIGLHHMIEIQSLNSIAPMYYYKFEYESDISIIKKIMDINVKGTCHGDELSYLFHPKLIKKFRKNAPNYGSVEHHIIQRFTDLWTNFAKTGNPTPQITDEISVEWKSIDSSNKYNCLYITENLILTKETNITQQLINSIKKNHK